MLSVKAVLETIRVDGEAENEGTLQINLGYQGKSPAI